MIEWAFSKECATNTLHALPSYRNKLWIIHWQKCPCDFTITSLIRKTCSSRSLYLNNVFPYVIKTQPFILFWLIKDSYGLVGTALCVLLNPGTHCVSSDKQHTVEVMLCLLPNPSFTSLVPSSSSLRTLVLGILSCGVRSPTILRLSYWGHDERRTCGEPEKKLWDDKRFLASSQLPVVWVVLNETQHTVQQKHILFCFSVYSA